MPDEKPFYDVTDGVPYEGRPYIDGFKGRLTPSLQAPDFDALNPERITTLTDLDPIAQSYGARAPRPVVRSGHQGPGAGKRASAGRKTGAEKLVEHSKKRGDSKTGKSTLKGASSTTLSDRNRARQLNHKKVNTMSKDNNTSILLSIGSFLFVDYPVLGIVVLILAIGAIIRLVKRVTGPDALTFGGVIGDITGLEFGVKAASNP